MRLQAAQEHQVEGKAGAQVRVGGWVGVCKPAGNLSCAREASEPVCRVGEGIRVQYCNTPGVSTDTGTRKQGQAGEVGTEMAAL